MYANMQGLFYFFVNVFLKVFLRILLKQNKFASCRKMSVKYLVTAFSA